MHSKTQVRAIFKCPLERAFKSPMLCDITKIHTGYVLIPCVTHCTEDSDWGKIGGSRKVFMKKNLMSSGGEAAVDTVLERIENEYWKIEISDFKFFAMGFTKFQGEWTTREINQDWIEVLYTYTLFSNSVLAYPFHWFITKVFWRIYMKHVVENIKKLAYSESPYLHG